MGPEGYGQILEVNLQNGETKRREISPEWARKYIGGMGFGAKILFDEVGPEVDPFDPRNVLIFANGPLTGTQAPCSGRMEVTTKSPLTGSIGTGNTGGTWGVTLKRAGYDVLVIRNQADRPLYLWIDDGRVELREADHLWGKDTEATTDLLRRDLSSRRNEVAVLAIGPAGENRVRFACPINDSHHAAARAGAGAVMGAQRLKAIAVRGTGIRPMARRDEFVKAAQEARKRLQASVQAASGQKPQDVIGNFQSLGCHPFRNFQSGVLPPHRGEALGRQAALPYYVKKEATCFACPISCFNLMEVKEGRWSGVRVNRGLHPGVVVEWGAKCALDNLPAIWKCKELCQQLGMDYAAAAGVVAWAMELFQRKMITEKDTEGLNLIWGNEEETVKLLHQIAHRQGFGHLLAEGSVRAAGLLGRGSARLVMALKGMEMMSVDPRAGRKGWIIGDLTNPRGGDNLKGTHFHADQYRPHWWVDQFDMPPEVKGRIYGGFKEEIASTWQGKAEMGKWFEDLYSALNALGLCIFPAGFNMALGPTYLARMYSALTGWDFGPEQIMASGERVFNLVKSYAVRQGFTRKDDAWPERFYEEALPDGPARGRRLSREEVDGLLDEYYRLRGWDQKSGIPTERKLRELGLEEMARNLSEWGILPGSKELRRPVVPGTLKKV